VELLNCLHSISQHISALNAEVIVADNGSTDESIEQAERNFPLFRYLRLGDNLGFAAACNRAIEAAKGRHLMLLNPDTEIEQNSLEPLIEALDKHPNWGIVGPMMTDFSGQPYRAARRFPTPFYLFCEATRLSYLFPRSKLFAGYFYSERAIQDLDSVDQIEGSALVISRDAFSKVGKLDEQFFIFFEEVDWCRRVHDAGFEIHVIPAAQIKHIRSSTMSRHFIRIRRIHAESAMKYFRKHHGNAGLNKLRRWMRAGLWIREWGMRAAVLFGGGERAQLRAEAARAERQIYRRGLVA
jgi:GT2 family glycosyltransferase